MKKYLNQFAWVSMLGLCLWWGVRLVHSFIAYERAKDSLILEYQKSFQKLEYALTNKSKVVVPLNQ